MTGIELITEERKRQIEVEGYTPEMDRQHTDEELALLATCYVMPQSRRIYYPCAWRKSVPSFYPNWNIEWWKPTSDDRIRELTKAGALIAAEIDRFLLKEKEL